MIIQTRPEQYDLLTGTYPKIQITCTSLSNIQIYDKAYLTIVQELNADKLGVIMHKGEVDLTINATEIDCTVLKRAKAKIQGNAIMARVSVYHDGFYDGLGLDACEVYTYLHNNGQAAVAVADYLEVSLFSRGKLRYKGSPRMLLLNIDQGSSIKSLSNGNLLSSSKHR